MVGFEFDGYGYKKGSNSRWIVHALSALTSCKSKYSIGFNLIVHFVEMFRLNLNIYVRPYTYQYDVGRI